MKKQMKHFAWIACMATAMIGLQSCDNDDKDLAQAPTDIQKAFDAKYPDTRVTEWELDRGEYPDLYRSPDCRLKKRKGERNFFPL